MTLPPPTDPAGWLVDVEVWALSWRDGALHHRCLTRTLGVGALPHDAARDLAGLRTDDDAALCHSTSWRVDDAHRLVLTYAALPDRAPGGTAVYEPSRIVAAADPVSPQPEALERENVLAHALRHLAMLSREDPVIRSLVHHEPELWEAIRAAASRTVTAPEPQPTSEGAS